MWILIIEALGNYDEQTSHFYDILLTKRLINKENNLQMQIMTYHKLQTYFMHVCRCSHWEPLLNDMTTGYVLMSHSEILKWHWNISWTLKIWLLVKRKEMPDDSLHCTSLFGHIRSHRKQEQRQDFLQKHYARENKKQDMVVLWSLPRLNTRTNSTCLSYNTDTVHASHHSNQTFNLDTPQRWSKHRDHHQLQQAAWWMSFQTMASATSSIHQHHRASGCVTLQLLLWFWPHKFLPLHFQ